MLWEQLGFKKSPYFWEELGVDDVSQELFVGRQNEKNKFLINVSSATDGGLVIVEGISGVGKTSFVNHNQYALYKKLNNKYPKIQFSLPNLFPTLRKVQLKNGEPFSSVLIKVISSVIFSVRTHCQISSIKFPVELNNIMKFVTDIVSSSNSTGVGVSVLGCGGSISKGNSSALSDTSNFREIAFLEYLNEIVSVVKSKLGFRGIIIPINNLDIVPMEYLREILDYSRDSFFNKKDIWWVLLGPKGLDQYLNTHIPRLAGVVSGEAIELGRFSNDELSELLEGRLKALSIRKGTVAPISTNLIHFLYEKSGGDLRFAFQVADKVVMKIFYDYPSISEIDEKLATKSFVLVTIQEIAKLTSSEIDKSIISYFISENITSVPVCDLVDRFKNNGNVALAVESLIEKRLLKRFETSSGDSFVSPKGYTSLAQHLGFKKHGLILENV